MERRRNLFKSKCFVQKVDRNTETVILRFFPALARGSVIFYRDMHDEK